MKLFATTLTSLIILSGAAYAAEPAKVMETSAGKIWTDMNDMALYTFDRDEAGKSNCYEQCAVNWPPFKADASAQAEGKWTVVDRTDGTKMWAYDGKPLYTYFEDKAAGDVKGEGKGGVWHLARAE